MPVQSITSLIALNQATGLLSPLFGPLADRWGYRVMLLSGLTMVAVGLIAAGVFPLYGVLVITLLVSGLGASIFNPALRAYIGDQIPYARRGRVIGMVEMSWAGSSLIGIPAAGFLIDRLGWQAPFVVFGGVVILCTILLALLTPRTSQQASATPTKPGYAAMWQLLLKSPAAFGSLGFGICSGLAVDNLFVILGLWLESFELSLVGVGLATSVIGVAELIGDTLTATVADRIGLKRAVFIGQSMVVCGYLLLPIISINLPFALLGVFILFLFFEFTVVTALSLFTEILPKARATMISSTTAATGLGRMTGVLIGGFLWGIGGLPLVAVLSAVSAGLGLACLGWGLRRWQD